ncbi:MAG: diacylglycerol kinase family lipid kinase [Lachnospiraceae bacterium]|nr:diacylglycerol kinase family lipid kinase [Lachnospiraceae bacterium]
MESKLLLIINPVAGKTKSKSMLFTVTNIFCKAGYLVTTKITQYRGHSIEIIKEYGQYFDLIVCCGGDGTLNEVIAGLLESGLDIPLGYIPAGSTNDFASTLALSGKPAVAAANITTGTPCKLDIGMFNNRSFSYIASFGAFTAASYSTSQEMKNTFGHLAYIFEGIRELPSIQPYHMVVSTPEAVYDNNYIFGSITNSTSVAGIVKLDNSIVDLCDGLFEVILVKMPQNIVQLNKILTSIRTSDFDNEMFDYFKASELYVSSDSPISWTLDGEHVPDITNTKIRNLSGAISIIK